jgi:hypothetical protein
MGNNNKKIRRQLRHERNIKKDQDYKKEAWESGKLIEENHNSGPYTSDYTIELSERLVQYILQERNKAMKDSEPERKFVESFRKYKKKIQTLILHWSPIVPENQEYNFLKELLEIYWDEVVSNNNYSALWKCSLTQP